MTIKNKSQKLRFVSVGLANTTIDFSILFVLKFFFGIPPLVANIVSTTAAFCFSFFANKKYTFKTTGTNLTREILLFTVVTLFGLWGLQTIVIHLVIEILNYTPLAGSDQIILLIAKILATIISLIWNYILYSNVVFKSTKKE